MEDNWFSINGRHPSMKSLAIKLEEGSLTYHIYYSYTATNQLLNVLK